MSRLTEALERYKLHEQLWLQFLYLGPNAELQQKLGDVRVLLNDPETLQSGFALKGVALRQAYSDRLVYANCRTALISKQIKVQRLTEMRDSLQEAIEALNALDSMRCTSRACSKPFIEELEPLLGDRRCKYPVRPKCRIQYLRRVSIWARADIQVAFG
jgi:hypothetical protein